MRLGILVLMLMLLLGCGQASMPASVTLTITPSVPLRVGNVGDMYLQSFYAAGGKEPYTWSLVSGTLPKGMGFTSQGVLYGTPEQSGTFDFTIQVVDAASATATLQIRGKGNEVSKNTAHVFIFACRAGADACSG